jgi:ABC-type transporter Mla subunit MlaD
MDERARYFKRLRRLRASARRWTVLAGTLGGASAVLVPYHGLGAGDAVWAAAAGGSAALAMWRWSDARALGAQPAPPPALAPVRGLPGLVSRLPVGRAALDELNRQRARFRLRGSAIAGSWQRLDRASMTLSGLAGRLGGPAEGAVLEAAAAEQSLRELAERAAGVERALALAPPDTRDALAQAHRALVAQLDDGILAYERLVAAAAGYVAEDGRPLGPESLAIMRLREATDLLRGIAAGLSELRTTTNPMLG